MTNVTGLGLDVGLRVHFIRTVAKLDLSLFVVYADGFDLFLASNVADNLVDVIPGIEHHRVVGAQFDGVGQPVGGRRDVFHQLNTLVAHAVIGPDRQGHQQRQTDGYNEF